MSGAGKLDQTRPLSPGHILARADLGGVLPDVSHHGVIGEVAPAVPADEDALQHGVQVFRQERLFDEIARADE